MLRSAIFSCTILSLARMPVHRLPERARLAKRVFYLRAGRAGRRGQ